MPFVRAWRRRERTPRSSLENDLCVRRGCRSCSRNRERCWPTGKFLFGVSLVIVRVCDCGVIGGVVGSNVAVFKVAFVAFVIKGVVLVAVLVIVVTVDIVAVCVVVVVAVYFDVVDIVDVSLVAVAGVAEGAGSVFGIKAGLYLWLVCTRTVPQEHAIKVSRWPNGTVTPPPPPILHACLV